ncbi:MAG: serine/threonine-protein kinase [Nannocystaceae bacterium]|nr:serine/threonine-protein kinase [Nannocystaceae bacterium]
MFSADDTLASPHAGPPVRAADGSLRRGEALGRYLVLDRLGAGGMGVVWSAYDPELDRKVAIKLMHRSGGSETPPMQRALGKVMNALFGEDDVGVAETAPRDRSPGEVAIDVDQQRLLREAQAAARINHPNVVTVHDVGQYRGQVFVAMEYVAGKTLRQWCLERPRSWREIVAVLVDAAVGLEAAHASGLIHRDFKPDNVMVGDDGRVRVMDFGLVRPGGARPDDDETLQPTTDALALELTAHGSMVGTPAYMSPEQHLGRTLDARSDQFSFCVTLWEALYGVRPFGGSSLAALATAVTTGVITEPPSDRDVPPALRRIVLRGLATDPQARWPSLRELVAALRRDPTRARRRAGAVTTVVVVGAGLLGLREADRASARRACVEAGTAIAERWSPTLRQSVDERLRAANASYGAATAERVLEALDAYAASWSSVRQDSCLAALAAPAPARDAEIGACLDERAEALDVLAQALAVAEPGDVRHAVLQARALHAPERCTDDTELARRTLAREHEIESPEALHRFAHAETLAGLGRHAPARAELEALLAQTDVGPRLRVRTQVRLGVVRSREGDFAGAESILLDAADAAMRAGADESLAAAAGELVDVIGYRQARAKDAEPWLRWGRAAIARTHAEATLVGAGFDERAGNFALSQGDADAATTQLERALAIKRAELGAEHPEVALTLSMLGNAQIQRKGIDDAMASWREALAIQERALGPDHPDLAGVLTNLAQAHFRKGELPTAKALIERALVIQRAEYSDNHPEVARSLGNLGLVLQSMGELEAARDTLARASAVIEASMGPEHRSLASNLSTQGGVEIKLGNFDAGVALLRRALAIQERNLAPDHIEIAVTCSKIGDALVARDDWAQALPWYQRSLSICEAQRHKVFTPIALFNVGNTLRKLGRGREAVPLLERAAEAFAAEQQAPESLAQARMALGLALGSEPGDRERVRTLLQQARATLLELHDDERVAEIDAAMPALAPAAVTPR